jgi:hypothetical protein
MHESDIASLFKSDFRIKQLVAMIFDKYDEAMKELDFTYHVSAIHSLSFMHKMYDLEISNDQKNLLVDALASI